MSLYNAVFGRCPAAPFLLAMLGIEQTTVSKYPLGRVRDVYPSPKGDTIILFTRNGGGNRPDYQHVFEALKKHPNYIRDYDDEFDCTYAYIEFSVPEKYKEAVRKLADQVDTTPPMEKFQKLMDDMKAGRDTAPVSRALDLGKKIFSAFNEGKDAVVGNEEGTVEVLGVQPPIKKTDEEINELNKRQHDPRLHPMTCGGDRTDAKHLDGEGVLVATKDGWVCPFCDYRQPY